MHLLHLLSQLDALRAGLHTPAPNERWLADLEHTLSDTLGGLETYRLVVASPTQLQEYFFLLDAFAHPATGQPLTQRRQQACQALLLLESMAPEREKTWGDSHACCWLMPAAAAGGETSAATAAGS
ncbi:hypothetical protein [Hymenobacter yonginensis]|uniref:Uncharacterized protein n=1 Tax=Hymenobacter yonginensis TaxID=748197 RepID=A0ABY7PTQ8_9BACT|nr:hypothetical protein [Hymenobacter yonginensis]WBO85987.1 hypothetical protein O9Z63_06970 [Hymenobacter yonginensis]